MTMDLDHDEFLCRIAKTLYYGKPSSLDSISLPLTELAAEIFSEVKKDNGLERLLVKEVAEFNQNACVSTCSLVLAILYLEKIKNTNPEYVEKIAPSELFLVSLLVASKFLHDDGEEESFSNYSWSVCAGLPLKKVNEIEKKFLQAIGWNVSVTEKQFWSKLSKIEKYLANRAGKRRGWYSYTELNVLLTGNELLVLKALLKNSFLCITCYAASILLLISSGLLAIQLKHILLQCVITASYSGPDSLPSNNLDLPSTSSSPELISDVKLSEANTSNVITTVVPSAEYDKNMSHTLQSAVCDSVLSCYFENISFELNYLQVKFAAINWKMRKLRSDGTTAVQKNSFLRV